MEDMRNSSINIGDIDIWEEEGGKAVLLIVIEKEEEEGARKGE